MTKVRGRRRAVAAVVALTFLVVAAACGGGGDDTATTATTATTTTTTNPAAEGAAGADFSARGPYAVGVTSMELGGGVPVEVFYPVEAEEVPADAVGFGYTLDDLGGSQVAMWPLAWAQEIPDVWEDVPPSTEGPFPLVAFSHGWSRTRFFYSLHTAHLASWGFVVAAPEHPIRDLEAFTAESQDTLPPSDEATIVATIDLLLAENERSGGMLEGQVAVDDVAVDGHSAGGRDATLAAYDDRVDALISAVGSPPIPDDAVAEGTLFRPVSGFDVDGFYAATPPPDVPALLVGADGDVMVLPSSFQGVYEWLAPPKRLVILADTGHQAFQDGCALFQDGELPGLVEMLDLDPESDTVVGANNGCEPEDAPAGDVQAVWNHLSVAQLRWVFGIDAEVATASLEPGFLSDTFPGRIADVAAEP